MSALATLPSTIEVIASLLNKHGYYHKNGHCFVTAYGIAQAIIHAGMVVTVEEVQAAQAMARRRCKMTRLSAHDIQEALDYIDQQIRDAELDNWRFAHNRGYAARMAGKPREAMYGLDALDNPWLEGWDEADAQLQSEVQS